MKAKDITVSIDVYDDYISISKEYDYIVDKIKEVMDNTYYHELDFAQSDIQLIISGSNSELYDFIHCLSYYYDILVQ